MAPSTGLLLGYASICLWWLARRRDHPITRRLVASAAPLLVLGGAYICLRHAMGWDSPIEEWLSTPAHGREDLRVGEMSAATGAAIMGVGISLAMLAVRGRSVWYWIVPLVISTGTIILEISVLAFYLAGGNWPWRGLFSPVALWSAIVLTLQSGAILIVLHHNGRKQLASEPSAGRFRLRSAWLIASGVALGMSFVGMLYLRHEQFELRAEHTARLHALARSKAGQIAEWRSDRLADADLLARSSMVARSLAHFIDEPFNDSAQADVVNLLGILKTSRRYTSADFYDANGQPVVAFSQEPVSTANAVLQQAMRKGQQEESPRISELYLCGECGEVHQDIVIPLFTPAIERKESLLATLSEPGTDFLGWIILRLDPHDFLFPVLQAPAVLGKSCEVILLRREAQGLTFLSAPQGDGSLLFSEVGTELSEAVLAPDTEKPSRDYRGHTVLAGASAVPGTPWVVVAKVDWGEVHETVHERAWLLIALTLIVATLRRIACPLDSGSA